MKKNESDYVKLYECSENTELGKLLFQYIDNDIKEYFLIKKASETSEILSFVQPTNKKECFTYCDFVINLPIESVTITQKKEIIIHTDYETIIFDTIDHAITFKPRFIANKQNIIMPKANEKTDVN